jgi:transaldolase
MNLITELKVKIFADSADKTGIFDMYKNPVIKGFTTNPTLMRKAGITNYKEFAIDVLNHIKDRPFSFEVFSDDFDEMHEQALEISSWGNHVYVKLPITNTKSEHSYELIKSLAEHQVKMNVTAIMTIDQVYHATEALMNAPSSYVSVFAGRIADTGCDPVPVMKKCIEIMNPYKQLELIWASPRELLNIIQANEIGCHIITVTPDILKKLNLIGKDLNQYSLETVEMFYKDALAAGYQIIPLQKAV